MTTQDIKNEFIRKYKAGEFRKNKNATQQATTIEIQDAHFTVDKPWIIREPNYDYAARELEWYDSQSLNVNDIPDGAPKQWKMCATPTGEINSNYGWCIFSDENYNQFENCIKHLVDDPYTREACMIYNRPSMQQDYCRDGMHDFMCTYSVQCFLNETERGYALDYIVYMRSNDAVFGFNNDALWHIHVHHLMREELEKRTNVPIELGELKWNAASLHIYERHFKYLE